ncbi:hypothetical protein GTA08_BOTSDO06116 [Botryosphaeria dothidea]|uniref:Uncharacterized protein n=1 Tax=Botryosphaeria dothidea TaxID=55169 RepID=A0A8H4N2M2_9PEZI|nr:hypothetical protein GTA08_BOTSDO06116 [Botryosphaeria dothidea]
MNRERNRVDAGQKSLGRHWSDFAFSDTFQTIGAPTTGEPRTGHYMKQVTTFTHKFEANDPLQYAEAIHYMNMAVISRLSHASRGRSSNKIALQPADFVTAANLKTQGQIAPIEAHELQSCNVAIGPHRILMDASLLPEPSFQTIPIPTSAALEQPMSPVAYYVPARLADARLAHARLTHAYPGHAYSFNYPPSIASVLASPTPSVGVPSRVREDQLALIPGSTSSVFRPACELACGYRSENAIKAATYINNLKKGQSWDVLLGGFAWLIKRMLPDGKPPETGLCRRHLQLLAQYIHLKISIKIDVLWERICHVYRNMSQLGDLLCGAETAYWFYQARRPVRPADGLRPYAFSNRLGIPTELTYISVCPGTTVSG